METIFEPQMEKSLKSYKTDCVVPENIHTPTTERIGNSEGEESKRPRKFQRGGGCIIELVSRGIPEDLSFNMDLSGDQAV